MKKLLLLFSLSALFLHLVALLAGQPPDLGNTELVKILEKDQVFDTTLISICGLSTEVITNLAVLLGACLALKGGDILDYYCERETLNYRV